ncbi:lysophospholipase L1-like esterase [Arthrobacter sp. SLBN-112]|nr:lysophospholipase L1-like esterase [Arthrobacter sp. SLBN-112]
MGNTALRRRLPAFVAGLASLVMASGLAAIPAEAASSKVDYVALGDSYTAGTGAGPFDFGYPCDKTRGGYVDVVGKTGRVNLLDNAACHGAFLTLDPLSPVLHDLRIPNVEQQISSLAGSSLTPESELVSITAGANDVGVTGVLLTCLTQPAQDCTAAIQASAALFPSMQTHFMSVLHQIHTAAPNARIAVLGYPRLFNPTTPFGQADPSLLYSINTAVDGLNTAIEGAVAASGTGAVFINVSGGFVGHEVNSADSWIFFSPPTVSPSGPVFDPRNFHPNKEGHRAYASALLEAVKPSQLVTR